MIFVFTKYDRLVNQIKMAWGGNTDVEHDAHRYLQEYCVRPIQSLTKEQYIPYIAVTGGYSTVCW